jgi:hypothetical protein
MRGNSQPHREARLEEQSREVRAPGVPKDAGIEATRNSIAGVAFEMQNPGKPGDLAQG